MNTCLVIQGMWQHTLKKKLHFEKDFFFLKSALNLGPIQRTSIFFKRLKSVHQYHLYCKR